MKLHYQTSISTFVQLVAMVPLVLTNSLVQGVAGCGDVSGSDCAFNILFYMFAVIGIAIWYALLCAIGFAAQTRRSKRLAYLLIAAEIVTAGVAILVIQHPANVFEAFVAVTALCLAGWNSVLAWRLSKSKGGRIVTPERQRARKRVVNHANREL